MSIKTHYATQLDLQGELSDHSIQEHDDHPCDLAFPWRIGCGLAMGDWRVYASLIMHWARATRTRDGRHIKVAVYQLPPQSKE